MTERETPAVNDDLSPVEQRIAATLSSHAEQMSRRAFVHRVGKALVGFVAGATLTPGVVIRTERADASHADSCWGDWRNCGLYGNLCAKCGGSSHGWSCPPGSTGGGSWYYCCPSGGVYYEFRYADCCKAGCSCQSGAWCPRHPIAQDYWDCNATTYCCTRTIYVSANC